MTKLGKYELIEELGRGGYGTVYRATDTALEVPRAVKVLHPALVADPSFIERFRREARFAARMRHPHIVPVFELDEVEGSYFMVMKYMPGGSLKELIAEKGRLPFERALEITRQIAEALDFAHGQPEQLIHRDVKPGNILFEADGNARLSDFGFAKALTGTHSASLTASGGMIGTPPYMAPEVWRGKDISPATDVYSLACVFCEMLTGKVLFAGESPPEIMTKHMLEGPAYPGQWGTDVPNNLSDVIADALAMTVTERFATANQFVIALSSLETPAQHEARLKTEAEERDRKELQERARIAAEKRTQEEGDEKQRLTQTLVERRSARQIQKNQQDESRKIVEFKTQVREAIDRKEWDNAPFLDGQLSPLENKGKNIKFWWKQYWKPILWIILGWAIGGAIGLAIIWTIGGAIGEAIGEAIGLAIGLAIGWAIAVVIGGSMMMWQLSKAADKERFRVEAQAQAEREPAAQMQCQVEQEKRRI